MRTKRFRHLYGPVPSRRLGLSLGVDIVPYKICSFDCIYCQLGRTTELTSVPRPIADKPSIMSELKEWLAAGNTADYITFAGSGEPTLNSELADMINEMLCITDLPVAIITNGSLLSDPDVRHAVMNADVLLPSLDAGTESTFQKVNRPVHGLDLKVVVDGLVRARQEFQGEFWLEVVLVKDLNDTQAELHEMAEIIKKIDPDKVQINTVERPSRSGEVFAVSQDTLNRAVLAFGMRSEIITSKHLNAHASKPDESAVEFILNLLSRRPCTLNDITATTGMHIHEVTKHLRDLMSGGLVAATDQSANPYYYLIDKRRETYVQ